MVPEQLMRTNLADCGWKQTTKYTRASLRNQQNKSAGWESLFCCQMQLYKPKLISKCMISVVREFLRTPSIR